MRVEANDQDEGIDDDISYGIILGNLMINGTPTFSINTTTGVISVNVLSLDREEHDEYSLQIEVHNLYFSIVLLAVI